MLKQGQRVAEIEPGPDIHHPCDRSVAGNRNRLDLIWRDRCIGGNCLSLAGGDELLHTRPFQLTGEIPD